MEVLTGIIFFILFVVAGLMTSYSALLYRDLYRLKNKLGDDVFQWLIKEEENG
jgi:hypothetical protein